MAVSTESLLVALPTTLRKLFDYASMEAQPVHGVRELFNLVTARAFCLSVTGRTGLKISHAVGRSPGLSVNYPPGITIGSSLPFHALHMAQIALCRGFSCRVAIETFVHSGELLSGYSIVVGNGIVTECALIPSSQKLFVAYSDRPFYYDSPFDF